MLIGNNRKLESKVALTLSILDYKVDNICNFKYLGIFISADFTWTNHVEYIASKVNQRLGLLKRIKHLLPFKSRLLYYNSLVMPLFDYADLVWGDKHNVNLMSSLHILQNKAAKIVLDRHPYSSASHALATLKWVTLEKRRFMRRCAHVYKCLNGIVGHSLILTKHEDEHKHNTRNKSKLKLLRTKTNWGQEGTGFHAVNDFNSLSFKCKNSRNLILFKRNVSNFS